MAKFHVSRLIFMFPVVLVLGFILWKWANGSDSADPNLDCRMVAKCLQMDPHIVVLA